MKTSSSPNGTADYASDEIVFIPRKHIHPDPDQPRVNADAELRASIESQGIIQAITVRPHPAIGEAFLIVDGERRYNGSVALAEIPCRIRLDLEDDADRLVTQITANTGKPLSPIEQARAFKKILDADEKLTQVELARRLGLPRATIGDRIRLLDLHEVWLGLITSGKLQLSHAPLIHKYRAVPDDYQAKAAAALLADYRAKKYLDNGDAIPVDEFKHLIYVGFRDFIKALADVPGYDGQVISIEGRYGGYNGGKEEKYAADIAVWRPIHRKRESARRKRQSSGSSSASHAPRQVDRIAKALKASPDIAIPVRKSKEYFAQPRKGETEIFSENSGWERGLDPTALLELLTPSDLTVLQGTGPARVVVANDAAIAAARKSFAGQVRNAAAKQLAPLRAKLTDDVLAKFAVSGPGVAHLLTRVPRANVVAMALDIDCDGLDGDGDEDASAAVTGATEDLQRVAAAVAAIAALNLNVPQLWDAERIVAERARKVEFRIPIAVSKKQEKRDARGRGEQVGDPTRAPAPRARQFEEELVGA